jgi:hemin uptake protein HemP
MLDSTSPTPLGHANDAESDRMPIDRLRPPRVDSARLLAGSRELVIDHAGQEYRLRLTRNGKLILTK